MDDIITRIMDMPTLIKGFTLLDDDGNFNIYINARLDTFAQRRTYMHELEHIQNGDFYSVEDIRVLEGDCHG